MSQLDRNHCDMDLLRANQDVLQAELNSALERVQKLKRGRPRPGNWGVVVRFNKNGVKAGNVFRIKYILMSYFIVYVTLSLNRMVWLLLTCSMRILCKLYVNAFFVLRVFVNVAKHICSQHNIPRDSTVVGDHSKTMICSFRSFQIICGSFRIN